MKSLTALFFILSGLLVNAQNWKLINAHEVFNYRLSDAISITHSIWVDSSAFNEGDSIYYLNRIVTDCDTCQESSYKLCNQSQFLMKEVVFDSDGIYRFQNPDTLEIHSQANLGDTWMFDAYLGVTAEVTNMREEEIFGETDSIKTIMLSYGDVIEISKNHGIVLFHHFGQDYYHLEGIEGRNLGDLVPKFNDFFNFNIGDVFQYEISGGYASDQYETLEKVEVTAKGDASEYIDYQTHVIGRRINYQHDPYPIPTDTAYYDYTNTLIFIDSTDHIANAYNNQLIRKPVSWGDYDSYIKLSSKYGRITKELSDEIGTLYMHGNVANPNGAYELLIPVVCFIVYFKQELAVGLGNIENKETQNEYDYHKRLIGFVKDGDTTGIIYSDSYLLSAQEFSKTPSLKIYPNPAKDFIHIEGIPKETKVELRDAYGRLIQSKVVTGETQNLIFTIKSLPSGLYFIALMQNNTVKVSKIIIQ